MTAETALTYVFNVATAQ